MKKLSGQITRCWPHIIPLHDFACITSKSPYVCPGPYKQSSNILPSSLNACLMLNNNQYLKVGFRNDKAASLVFTVRSSVFHNNKVANTILLKKREMQTFYKEGSNIHFIMNVQTNGYNGNGIENSLWSYGCAFSCCFGPILYKGWVNWDIKLKSQHVSSMFAACWLHDCFNPCVAFGSIWPDSMFNPPVTFIFTNIFYPWWRDCWFSLSTPQAIYALFPITDADLPLQFRWLRQPQRCHQGKTHHCCHGRLLWGKVSPGRKVKTNVTWKCTLYP